MSNYVKEEVPNIDSIKEEITVEEGCDFEVVIKQEEHKVQDDVYLENSETNKTRKKSRQNSPPNRTCEVCGKKIKGHSHNYQVHLRTHSNERNFNCDQCDKAFKTKKYLVEHKNTVHATEKPFQCEVYSKRYPTSFFLKKHTLKHDTNNILKCRCEVCGKTLSSAGALKIHMAMHGERNNFNCDQCDKTFKTDRYLAVHKSNMHATEKPFQCNVCSEKFVSVWVLKKHFKKHEEKKTHSDFTELWKEINATEKHLFEHKNIAYATGDPFESEVSSKAFPNALRFLCEFCGKKLSNWRSLKVHVTSHSARRNFNCDQCDKRFKTKQTLVAHKINLHATEKPFRCDVCSKRFASSRLLNIHCKIHEEEEPHTISAHATVKVTRTLNGKVKVEPLEVYDSGTKLEVVKGGLEEATSFMFVNVKQEPQDMEDS